MQTDLPPPVRAAARRLLAGFNGQLLSEEELAMRCLAKLADKPALTPEQACQNVYSQVLYAACSDAARQEQAYRELHFYLYRIARFRRPDIAEDATQEALLLIFKQLAACRGPETFLRFAQLKLLQAIKNVHQHQLGRKPEDALDDLAEHPAEPHSLFKNDALELWDCIRQLWVTHPRAHNQLRAVLWKYFDGLSDQEIGTRLETTPAQVQVLRSLGLKKVRQCLAE